MTDLALDPKSSRVRIHTFAEGLFARLAHDLELVCTGLRGTATRDGGRGTASVTAPVSGIEVAGVLEKSGRVDPEGLSASDRRDCLDKMRREVFQAGEGAVVKVEASLDGATAKVRLTPPNLRAVEVVVRPAIKDEEGATRVSGAFEVSLSSIGSGVVKGPMGAFKIRDRVTIAFDVVFRTAQPA